MKNKTIGLATILAMALFYSAAANAVELDGHLSLGGGTTYIPNSDFQAVSDGQMSGNAMLEFGMTVYHPIEIYALIGGDFAKRDYVLGITGTQLGALNTELGARIYYPLLSVMDVYGKLGLKYEYAKLRMGEVESYDDYDDEEYMNALRGKAHSFGGTAGVGFTIGFPRDLYMEIFGYEEDSFWANSTAGLFFEFGGNLQSKHDFDEMKPPEPDNEKDKAQQIENSAVNFGDINMSGIYWRAGLIFYY